MSENTKISIDNMNLHYGNFHALKGINMEIPEKEITAFIGPSGCGKSTLLKSLNRMNDLVEGCTITGKVELDGEDIYGDMDVNLLRKRVGMVFQKPNPFPMSIYDNIAYGPRTHGIRSKAKLDEIVEKSLRDAAIWDEVKDRLKKSALGMSGGQQQRLCIARALAVQPEVLLMDEPTSALDPISTSKIEDLAVELKKDYTIVMVTHNMQQATRISDKTAFFLLGEVVEFADTDKLFSMPADKRTEVILQEGLVDIMSERFVRQLEELHVELITMGSLCEKAISLSAKAIQGEGGMTLIGKIFETEKEIDAQEREIENLCMKLLLHEHPVAGDLRSISAALKMISDMERIGDQAADIADLSKHIEDKAVTGDIINIRKMAEDTVRMVTESIDAFVKGDLELCRKVIDDDDKVDDAFNDIKEKLAEVLNNGKPDASIGLDILMAAKYFERIGDHAVNIAEWVEYSITGNHRSGSSHTDNYFVEE